MNVACVLTFSLQNSSPIMFFFTAPDRSMTLTLIQLIVSKINHHFSPHDHIQVLRAITASITEWSFLALLLGRNIYQADYTHIKSDNPQNAFDQHKSIITEWLASGNASWAAH